MGKTQSKEEIVIAQNASGGNNSAHAEQLNYHLTTVNILLIIIVVFIALVVFYYIYRQYKKCHVQWIGREFEERATRRSFLRGRYLKPIEEQQQTA